MKQLRAEKGVNNTNSRSTKIQTPIYFFRGHTLICPRPKFTTIFIPSLHYHKEKSTDQDNEDDPSQWLYQFITLSTSYPFLIRFNYTSMHVCVCVCMLCIEEPASGQPNSRKRQKHFLPNSTLFRLCRLSKVQLHHIKFN